MEFQVEYNYDVSEGAHEEAIEHGWGVGSALATELQDNVHGTFWAVCTNVRIRKDEKPDG